MTSKAFRKTKKKWKTRIEKKVREAYRTERYLWVAIERDRDDGSVRHDFLFRIFYHRENRREKNHDINEIAYCLARMEHEGGVDNLEDIVKMRIEPGFPMPDDVVYESTLWEPYKIFLSIVATRGRTRHGKPLGRIVKDYKFLFKVDEVDQDEMITSLLKLVREYRLIVFSWMRAFWYKPWLRDVAREQGMAYLPTHKI